MPVPGQNPPEDDSPDDGESGEGTAGETGGGNRLAGSLLVAHPSLRDPNFRRTVLFLSAHDREAGAMGIILNRPLPDRTAADLLPGHESEELLARVPVYLGGPVGGDQLSFADLRLTDGPGGGVKFRHHLAMAEVAALAAEDPGRLRAFIGYAGWTGGQLEGEISQGAWMVVVPRARFLANAAASGEDRTWFRVMGSLGPAYKLLAAMPDDPSLN